MMNVLHVITGLNNGGAEAALYRLIAGDAASSSRHTVVSLMDRGVYADRLEAQGCQVLCLNMPSGRVTVNGLRRLYRYMRELRPSVVQTWMYHADLIGGLTARLAGIRTVVWGIRHANLDADKNSRLTLLIARILGRSSGMIPAKIACCSEVAVVPHTEIGYRADKITVIPNGYELGQLKPDSEARRRVRRELGIADDLPLIGMVARFHPQKDHGNLLDALARLEQENERYAAVLVGNGMTQDNESLTAMLRARALSDRIVLAGPRNDVPDIMNALDLHVLSSAGEAFPNVLAEAMACGTPCVSTDAGDAATIIGSTGWMAPTQNAEALAAAIQTALTDWRENRTDWAGRQEACRSRINEHFTVQKMVAAYHQLWTSAVVDHAALS